MSIKVPGVAREVRAKIASGREELEAAFQLLATNYQARGYEQPGTGYFRFTPYHVLPDTVTLVAKHEGRVVATLSLVPDTTLMGLPMDCIYRTEIDELRREGRRLAEATSLAAQGLEPREFVQVFKTLIMLSMRYHVHQGGDSWVISVHPRHRIFYQKLLGFVPLGPRRAYPRVQGHPAEAYLISVDLMKARAPAMYQYVFGEPLPDGVLRPHPWSPALVRHFAQRSTQADSRTIDEVLTRVERFGSPPLWREDDADLGRPRYHIRRSRAGGESEPPAWSDPVEPGTPAPHPRVVEFSKIGPQSRAMME